MDTTEEAPNFSRSYPLDGEVIGPAWRAMWAMLSDGNWRSIAQVHRELGQQSLILSRVPAAATVKTLLNEAARRKLIAKRSVTGVGPTARVRTRSQFRRE